MFNFLEITRSRLRHKVLSYFFTNPEIRLYLREIASILKEDAGNLSKELAKLEKEGVFLSEVRGNQKYLFLNKKYPLFKELKSIISKTIGAEGGLKEIMKKTDGILLAFIYGSFATDKQNTTSDIDLLIVGNPDEDTLMQNIDNLEKKLQREINYNIYPKAEFKLKLRKRNSFITNVLKRPKIILKGRLDEI